MSQVWVVRGSIMSGPLKHLKEIVTCRRYMRFGFWSTRISLRNYWSRHFKLFGFGFCFTFLGENWPKLNSNCLSPVHKFRRVSRVDQNPVGIHTRHATTFFKSLTGSKAIHPRITFGKSGSKLSQSKKINLWIASKNSKWTRIYSELYCSYKLTNTIPQIFSLYPLVAFCI